MILTGKEIQRQVQKGSIVIDPFDPARLNPNSYDFSLGPALKYYTEEILDPKKPNAYACLKIPAHGYRLQPDRIYLGHTHETMGSTYFAPVIKGKSSTARLGLFVHITADLIDIGSINQWTLQLHAIQPLTIYPGMLIGQVTFWAPKGEVTQYEGKYQGSKGPVESLSWKDYEEKSDDLV
jgi:dCTP deaminase